MLQIAPLKESQLTHIMVPQEFIKPRQKHPKITLKTRLRPFPALDGSKALAMIKRRKKRYKYVRQQERYTSDSAYPRKFFRPLQKYLTQKIKQGHIGPGMPIGTLLIITECGQTTGCAISYCL